ncbi:MAG: polyadenylate-specific 3'-exoribonuclease AS [Corynebacterium sp.]|nr:polyadenylate-specific 3'-exoribonuclease AS [Corynebacterium sp.]
MRFFYDTEFIEDGTTIELISIGIVREDGKEYYAVSTAFDPQKANDWVRKHVLRQLPSPGDSAWRSPEQIKADILEFLFEAPGDPELWAWVGAYDHVVLVQLWGDMMGLPRRVPRFTRELKQYWEFAGRPKLPKLPEGNHNALVDARHNLAKFKVCVEALPISAKNSAVGTA